MNCINCNKRIPAARRAALPGTLTCIACSQEKMKLGVTIWNDKSTPSLEIMDEVKAERFRRLEQIDGRLSRL